VRPEMHFVTVFMSSPQLATLNVAPILISVTRIRRMTNPLSRL
jgi:hypothetical protein